MNESRNSKRMAQSTKKYLNELFENTSKIQAIRVDLGYRKEYAREASLDDINKDISHLLNNRRTKPSVFENMIGHIVKREYTEDKGPHIHGFFFYDGHKVSKDAFKGDQIGRYWSHEITNGKGIYHNCNRGKDKYADCALGMIDHTDEKKRTALTDKAVSYLCKAEQSIEPIKQSSHERSFTRGIAPKRKCNAGRPRESGSKTVSSNDEG